MKNTSEKKFGIKNWFIILALFVFFASPFFIAQWLYYKKGDYVPSYLGTVNHGKLIQPLIPLKQVISASTPLPILNKKWTILYISTSSNAKNINPILDKIYRIRLALGKEFSKVGELFGSTQENALTPNPLKIPTVLLSVDGMQKLLQQLQLKQSIFLLDSSGNIFMAYPDNVNSDDIYKDIRRLLSNQ